MVDYREILRLNSLGNSQRQIEETVHSGHHTVSDTLATAREKGIAWPLDESVTNEKLQAILFPGKFQQRPQYLEPDYAYIHRELAKPGVTLALLWEEYCAKAKSVGAQPYMTTQFREKYHIWARVQNATMRLKHKPGDVMEVDWAGNTIPIYDPDTGAEDEAYLFVAVLPFSAYAYVEACADMKSECWIRCHMHAYEYFGGVTRLLVPDNLKTGVITNTRYDTVLNKSYRKLSSRNTCKGYSSYDMKPINDAVEAEVRKFFSRLSSRPSEDLTKLASARNVDLYSTALRQAENELENAQKQLSAAEEEAVKALTGENHMDLTVISNIIVRCTAKRDAAEHAVEDARRRLEEEKNTQKEAQTQIDEFLSWADCYDKASVETKHMIVTRLIERVEVFPNHKIHIKFRISIEQFLGQSA